jgi:dolichol-phosphate mannosyltransferase
VKPDLSVVIPVFNEVDALPVLIDSIKNYVQGIDFSIQFVFVDDGSVDDTYNQLCRDQIDGSMMKVVKLSKNFGSHAAIRAGIFHADSNNVVLYSADMPEPLSTISQYYTELSNGYEIVYSERVGYKGSLGSRIFGRLVKKLIDPTYPTNGLIGVGFGAKAKEQLNTDIEKNSSVFFQIFQLGFKKKGIPTEFNERTIGSSKWTFRKKIKLFIDSFVMFSYAPIRLITGLGVVMAILGILWALFIIITRLFRLIDFASGWPALSSMLLIGFGITNISLGIIAEYLVRTLDAARRSNTFITDEVFIPDEN